MAKKVNHHLPPELLYTLKYKNTEFYELKNKLLAHKHFLGGYIFGDKQLVIEIEKEVERHGLCPNKAKIINFLYARHYSISMKITEIMGYFLSDLLMLATEDFVFDNLDELKTILKKKAD